MQAPIPAALVDAFRLASAPTDEPCRYGHFDCATVEHGPCSGEALSVLIAAGLDLDDLATLAELEESTR